MAPKVDRTDLGVRHNTIRAMADYLVTTNTE